MLVFSLQHPHSSKGTESSSQNDLCLIYEEHMFAPTIGLPQGKLHMINCTDEGLRWDQTFLLKKQAENKMAFKKQKGLC